MRSVCWYSTDIPRNVTFVLAANTEVVRPKTPLSARNLKPVVFVAELKNVVVNANDVVMVLETIL